MTPIELKMPALSPTMEEGTLAKWLVKEGDAVKSGDLLAETEADKAAMELEAVDEGTIAKLVVTEGTESVKVGAVIALIAGEDEEASEAKVDAPKPDAAKTKRAKADAPKTKPAKHEAKAAKADMADDKAIRAGAPPVQAGDRVRASPLARRLAQAQGIDLATLSGSGPNGRIVQADLEDAPAGATKPAEPARPAAAQAAPPPGMSPDAPYEAVKLSNMRKTIARRLTESKQKNPHIYLTVDVRLDVLLKLRGELNKGLESRGVKLSVNDMLITALPVALIEVPACNVSFAGDTLYKFSRANISVAVSIPGGLITPIVAGADTKSISAIATEIKDLAARAKDGKPKPGEYQGGTASLSNMGRFGIKQFEAVINLPQGMILAIGAGEQQPYMVDGALGIATVMSATVMSATGSFDHRAIDGADGAQLMAAFKRLVENPLAMLA